MERLKDKFRILGVPGGMQRKARGSGLAS